MDLLPTEILFHIFSYLDIKDLIRLSMVNKWLSGLSRSNGLWKTIMNRDFPGKALPLDYYSYYRQCKSPMFTLTECNCGKNTYLGIYSSRENVLAVISSRVLDDNTLLYLKAIGSRYDHMLGNRLNNQYGINTELYNNYLRHATHNCRCNNCLSIISYLKILLPDILAETLTSQRHYEITSYLKYTVQPVYIDKSAI